MSKKFKNVSTDSGELTVRVNHTVVTFHLASGAEFSIEADENSDIEFYSSNPETMLVIEPVL